MEKKKTTKISFSTFFLIITIIALGVMGFFLYKINDEKTKATEQVSELNNQVEDLKNTVTNLKNSVTNSRVVEDTKDSSISGLYKASVQIDTNLTGDVSLSLEPSGKFSYFNDPRTNAGVSGHYTVNDNTIILNKELLHPNDPGGPYSTSGTITLIINDDGSITDENLHDRNIIVTLKKVLSEQTKEISDSNMVNTTKTLSVSEIKELLKNKGKYDILEVESLIKANNKISVKANYYEPKLFTEQQYNDMVKNKKIVLNNEEYIYEEYKPASSEYYHNDGEEFVHLEGRPLESGYKVEKFKNGYIFLGGYDNSTMFMLKDLKASYSFDLDINTKITSFGDIIFSDDGTLRNYAVIVYNEDTDELYVSVDPR